MKQLFGILFIIVFLVACGDEGEPMPGEMGVTPEITLKEAFVVERAEDFSIDVEVKLSQASEKSVSIDYKTVAKTASADVDYNSSSGTLVFSPGETLQKIPISILADDAKEMEEYLRVEFSNPENGTIERNVTNVFIKDGDVAVNNIGEGYETAEIQDGYELVWADEFEGDNLNEDNWSYEMGDGCNVGICGWGNNELQSYTDKEENIKVQNGKLTITANKDGSIYSSARIITKAKREFLFGRVDIRARLPRGQGLWPALWMLGSNIDDVGWPACGEIDIMELIGSKPKVSSSAVHWGNPGEGSTFKVKSFTLEEEFSERYHVFSILWKFNEVQFYVDETFYFSITPDDTQGFAYPFNANFFFIMNVAIGGNLPGSPDSSTEFPQTMDVDYIRVFQEK